MSSTSKSIRLIALFYLLIIAVANIAFYIVREQSHQEQMNQIKFSARDFLVQSDYGRLKEYLSSLTPELLSSFRIDLSGSLVRASNEELIEYFYDQENSRLLGRVYVVFNDKQAFEIIGLANLFIVLLFIASAAYSMRVTKMIVRTEATAYEEFLNLIQLAISTRAVLSPDSLNTNRRIELGGNLNRLIRDISNAKEMETYGHVAKQVAHDIRSPVSALRMIEKELTSNPDQQVLVRKLCDRIEKIAADLLNQPMSRVASKLEDALPEPLTNLETVTSKEINSWISDVIAEKTVTFTELTYVCDTLVDQSSTPSYVHLEESKFKRVLSNLLDNAIEASDRLGRVRVEFTQEPSRLVIDIRDNGQGMSPETLERAKEGGFTTKPSGTGSGLSDAIRTVRSWKGEVDVFTREGSGTTVTLVFGTFLDPT